MKNILMFMLLITVTVLTYSQSWTIQGGESNDTQFTIITAEQFQRTIRAHQATDRGVNVEYQDYLVFMNSTRSMRIISGGSLPNFNGYFYLAVRTIPKNDVGRYWSNVRTAWVIYGNTRTNAMMHVRFVNVDNIPNVLSLKTQYNEYIRQYNHLIRLVNGE